MGYPVVVIAGKAGSGKDTVADIMIRNHGAVAIAFADPMKRFAKHNFKFTDQQLWGPSEFRNTPVEYTEDQWADAEMSAHSANTFVQISEFGINLNIPAQTLNYEKWFKDVRKRAAVEGMKPRLVLQTFGTDVGRKFKPRIWTDYAMGTADKLLTEGGIYVANKGWEPSPDNYQFAVITDGRFRNEVLAVKAAGGVAVLVKNPAEAGVAGEIGKHVSETQQDSIPEWWYDIVIVNDKTQGLSYLENAIKWKMNAIYKRVA